MKKNEKKESNEVYRSKIYISSSWQFPRTDLVFTRVNNIHYDTPVHVIFTYLRLDLSHNGYTELLL